MDNMTRDINNKASNGLTVLHTACIAQDVELVERLLQMGADPNIPMPTGSQYRGGYPLHAAATNKGMQALLIQHGANTALRNEAGVTADELEQEILNFKIKANALTARLAFLSKP